MTYSDIVFYASLPKGYVNANLPDGEYLVSVASYWNGKHFRVPLCIPPRKYFIDCGAYSFGSQPLPWSFIEYVVFASAFNPTAVCLQDRKGDASITLDLLTTQIRMIQRLGYSLNFIPVIQGTTPQEYCDCFLQMKKIFAALNFNPRVVAVGNLKGTKSISSILKPLQDLNDGEFTFHLFGCSQKQMSDVHEMGDFPISSLDTGSWNGRFYGELERFNSIMKEKGMTQRQVALNVYLPKYRQRVSGIFAGL